MGRKSTQGSLPEQEKNGEGLSPTKGTDRAGGPDKTWVCGNERLFWTKKKQN